MSCLEILSTALTLPVLFCTFGDNYLLVHYLTVHLRYCICVYKEASHREESMKLLPYCDTAHVVPMQDV